MLGSCPFVGKRVLEQVLITFVRKMAYGNCLHFYFMVITVVYMFTTFSGASHILENVITS